MNLSRTDVKRILKGWKGPFQISKNDGRIVAVHVTKSITIDDLNEIDKLKEWIANAYPNEVKTSVSVKGSVYEFSISFRITRTEFMDFLKSKPFLIEEKVAIEGGTNK